MTAPRLTALGAEDQGRHELLAEARAVVAGTTAMLASDAMLRAAIEALDDVCADYGRQGELLDGKDLHIVELYDRVVAAEENAARLERTLAKLEATNTTLCTRLAAVSRLIQQALIKESVAHQVQAERFTQLCTIRDAADPSAAVPTGRTVTTTLPEETRLVASGV